MKLTDQALQDLKKQCIGAMGRNAVVANHQSLMLQMIDEIVESRSTKSPPKAAVKEEAPPPPKDEEPETKKPTAKKTKE